MKKIMLILFLLLAFPLFAVADRVVSDPAPSLIGLDYEIWQAAKGLTDVQVVATGTLITTKKYEANGSVSYVLDSLAPGTFYWYFRSVGLAYVYGPDNTPGGSTLYSVFVPFAFTKRSPVGGTIPGLRLAP